jgi:hypothetical protein
MKARAEEAEAKQKSQDDEKKRRDEELSMTQKISQGITTALRMAGVVAPLPQPGATGNLSGNMMHTQGGSMGSAPPMMNGMPNGPPSAAQGQPTYAQYPGQAPMNMAAAQGPPQQRAADSILGGLSNLLGRTDDGTDPLLRRLRQIDELDGLGSLFRHSRSTRSRSRGSGRSRSSRTSRKSTASAKKKDTDKKNKKEKKKNKKDDNSSTSDTSSSSKMKKTKKKKKQHRGDNSESDAGHREGGRSSFDQGIAARVAAASATAAAATAAATAHAVTRGSRSLPAIALLTEEQMMTAACRGLKESLGIVDVSAEPLLSHGDEDQIETYAAWLASKTSLVTLDALVKGAGIANRFESKLHKVKRLLKWSTE